jgi:hypothetical protein
VRPSFEELPAKYKKNGGTKKKKNGPNEVKSAKSSPKPQEQPDFCLHQGNSAAATYSLFGSVTPWFWSYPCYYSPLDYSRMYMQPYIIQYPSTYPNCGASQRSIVANDTVKSKFVDSKEGEENMKQDSKYLQPRWRPSGLTHTQKRKLQRLLKQKLLEHQSDKPVRKE